MADPTKANTAVGNPDLAFQIVPIGEEVEYLNMLVYGPYGSGKTTLLATAADVEEMADVLMIDIESGRMTIKDSTRIKNKAGIDAIRVSSFKQLGKVHEFLKAHCRFRDDPNATDKLIALEAKFKGVTPDKIKKPRKYYTVLMDSLSELDVLCMYELLGFPAPSEIDLNKTMNDGDMEVAEWGEFRKNNQMIQLIVRAYRDLPIHVLFSCHVAYVQDEQKRMFYSPSMTGKLSSQVQGFVDVVGYLTVGPIPEGKKEAPRRLYVQPVGKFAAKNRKAAFKESFFDDPTMSTIWKGLNN